LNNKENSIKEKKRKTSKHESNINKWKDCEGKSLKEKENMSE